MIKEAIDFDQELSDAQQQTTENIKIAQENGFVVDMAQWLTIKRYAEKYRVSQQVVVNWIGRGVIPANSTMILPELNDIRLVKDQPYK
jgi:hypothetical protein